MTREIRNTTGPVETRSDGDDERLTGYAAKYNRTSQNLGGFVERIAPGAFTKTLRDGGDVVALFNHDDNLLLGRTAAGTLRLEETDEGLHYEIDPPSTQVGQDVTTLVRRGDIQGSSFAFRTLDDEWGYTEDGFPLRTLKAVALFDVSPVTSPAYLDTDAAIRSYAEAFDVDRTLLQGATDFRAVSTDAQGNAEKPTGPPPSVLRHAHFL